MTTLQVVGDESLSDAVARRLRGLLAELRINQKELGERTGWGRAYVYRRLTGETPLDTADLERIERTTGIRAVYLVGESGPRYTPPSGPRDGVGLLLPRMDSNHQPPDYEDTLSGAASFIRFAPACAA
jgi:transcriptional regulator with XRE-family HTH domain